MQGLVEICGACADERQHLAGAGVGGDRTEDIIRGMAYIAGRSTDRVVIVEQLKYLRGRDRQETIDLRAGALDGGAGDVPDLPDELGGLRWMLRRARPGDVVAITALGQRPEIFDYLKHKGARRIGPARCRQLARRARGAD